MCVTCPAGRIAKRPAMSIRPIRLRPANGNPKVLYKSEIATYPARIFYLSEICIRNDISKDIKYRAIKLQQVDRASIFPPRLTWLGRVDTCIRFVKKRRSASSEEGAKGCWYAPGNPVPWPTAENGWKPSLSLSHRVWNWFDRLPLAFSSLGPWGAAFRKGSANSLEYYCGGRAEERAVRFDEVVKDARLEGIFFFTIFPRFSSR